MITVLTSSTAGVTKCFWLLDHFTSFNNVTFFRAGSSARTLLASNWQKIRLLMASTPCLVISGLSLNSKKAILGLSAKTRVNANIYQRISMKTISWINNSKKQWKVTCWSFNSQPLKFNFSFASWVPSRLILFLNSQVIFEISVNGVPCKVQWLIHWSWILLKKKG